MDERFTQPFWDARYGATDRVWSGNPNPQLVREVADLSPGLALEAGCGEGADAHWLARRGWQVSALDVSAVALARGAEHAGPEFAGRITWRQADLLAWEPEPDRYDLVTAHFMQLPSALRDPLFAALAASVAPGGTLLIVGHDLSDLGTALPRHGDPDMFFTAEQVAGKLEADRWEIVVAEARPRTAVHEGQEITIADAVLRARRRR